MSRVLAIGGTGFIGVPTVARLLARDHDVLIVHRGQRRASFPSEVQTATGERDDRDFLQKTARTFRPDVAVDFISYTEVQAQIVVDALSGHCGRLVTVSSADVYRNFDGLRRRSRIPPDDVPLTEDAPVRERLYPYRGTTDNGPSWLHDYEKLLVEQTVLGASELAGTAVRLSKVYGPHDSQKHLGSYLDRIVEANGSVRVERGQAAWRWSRGYVDDIGEAIAAVSSSESTSGRIYNLGDADALSESEWLDRVGREAGYDVTVHELMSGELPPAYRINHDWRFHLDVSTARVRQDLGFTEVVGREEGIRRTVAHILEQKNGNEHST